MAQGLQLSQRLTQSLVLPATPAVTGFVAAPTLELKALVEAELQQNPVLEEMASEPDLSERNGEGDNLAEAADPAEPPADVNVDHTEPGEGTEAAPVDDFQAEFEKLAQLDQEWRDHFSQTNVPNRATAEDEERRQFMFDSLVAGTRWPRVCWNRCAIPSCPWPTTRSRN